MKALAFLFLPFLAFSQTVTVRTVNDSTFQVVTESTAIDGSGFTQVSKYMTLAEVQSFLFQSTMQADAQKAQAEKQAQAVSVLTGSYKKEFEKRGGKYELKVAEVLGKEFTGTYRIRFGDENLGFFTLDDKMFLSGKGGNYPVEIVNPSVIRVSGLAKGAVTLESRDRVQFIGVGDEKKVVVKKVSNEVKPEKPVKDDVKEPVKENAAPKPAKAQKSAKKN